MDVLRQVAATLPPVRCRRCKRRLYDVESRRLEYGEVCLRKELERIGEWRRRPSGRHRRPLQAGPDLLDLLKEGTDVAG